jgi:hypothetical protein
LAGLSSEPLFETARDGCARTQSARHDNLVVDEAECVGDALRSGRLNADPGKFATEGDFAHAARDASPKALKPLHARKLIENPCRIDGEELGYFLSVACTRLYDFDSRRSHANAKLAGRLRVD